jgi:hypothetical protein
MRPRNVLNSVASEPRSLVPLTHIASPAGTLPTGNHLRWDVGRDLWALGGAYAPGHRRKTVSKFSKEIEMAWIIGGGILYLILVVTLGVMSIRKGHWVMFVIGFFLPFFWLIGALMPSRRLAY